MGNPALNKYGLFGFIAQGNGSTDGHMIDPATTGWTCVPFIDEPTFKWNPNAQVLDQADRIHHDHLIYSNVAYYTGGVSFYLMPGMLSAFLNWLQTKNAYNQNWFYSVFLWNYDVGSRFKIFASDVKIASAEFVIEQNSPVRVNLDLVGLADGRGAGPAIATEWDGALSDANIAPYINKETTFTFDPTGQAEAQSYDIRSCTVRVDTKLQSPDDGIRFNNSQSPYRLYNEGGLRVTGSFSRDYVDAACYNAFRAMYTSADWYANARYGAMTITLARAGVATLVMQLPRLAYNDHSSGMRGSRDGIMVESLDFTAMGARAVTDPKSPSTTFPIVLTAS